ncbi:hypothetical protein [Serratia fonticola]
MKSDNRTDAEKSAAAKALHARQRRYDKLHHEMRLKWLREKPCMWAHGYPMAEYERLTMLRGSKECLRLINDHGMSTNSVDLTATDSGYLAVLDEFERTGKDSRQHTHRGR